MNAVTKAEAVGEVQDYSNGLLAVIERAARDPSVDIDKMERLLAMQERVQERNAVAAFNDALAELQPLLPVITERGKIIVRDKTSNEIKQETPYALWEDINEAIRPLLHDHGFALTFKTGTANDGKLIVTGILKHRFGHQEEAAIPLPHDSSGSKNAVQAIGSSLSYGKRYAAMQLLNITTRGEDDDGQTATYKDAKGEPLARAQLVGPHTSKTALRSAIGDIRNKVRECVEVKQLNQLLKDGKDTIEQAERDWAILLNGDPRVPEDIGLRGEVERRRAELRESGGMFPALLTSMRECDTPDRLTKWRIANEEVVDGLDGAESRLFQREWDAHEAKLAEAR